METTKYHNGNGNLKWNRIKIHYGNGNQDGKQQNTIVIIVRDQIKIHYGNGIIKVGTDMGNSKEP